MSRHRKLQSQIHDLNEIKQIMGSMKNLAYLEVRKVERLYDNAQQIVNELEKLAADFLSFHPIFSSKSKSDEQIWILFGTERGFCGNFNEGILEKLERHLENSGTKATRLIPVGQRICSLTVDDPRVSKYIAGPNIFEEITKTLKQVVFHIDSLQQHYASISVSAIYHNVGSAKIERCSLLPPFQDGISRRSYSQPPLLNLATESFFLELVNQYIFLKLHEIAYVSHMAENLDRMHHMHGAVQHLDEKINETVRKNNSVRQEEIIEEIEIMLLNTDMPQNLF